MCIYIVKNQKLKKNSSRGKRDSANVSKLSVLRVNDIAKTNRYLSMLCYIHVEYSVLFCW